MQLGVCTQALYHLTFEEAIKFAADMGFEAVELPVDAGSPFVKMEDALEGDWKRLKKTIEDAGLKISCLSNHQEGQLLLGPHADLHSVHDGTPEEKAAWSAKRLKMTADLAKLMEVETVIGFTGCEDYTRFFPWPLEDGYEQMSPVFRDRFLPVLDHYQSQGIRFGHECHPKQFAYNLETAQLALELVDNHPAFGFNYDPANLFLAGMDPVAFIAELGQRIWHVHAKDCELVKHHVGRSGMLSHGKWNRPGRGFRFRVCGWGDINWRHVISELQVQGYQGVLAIEHEDPTMSQPEGLAQAKAHLDPIVLRDPAPDGPRWW